MSNSVGIVTESIKTYGHSFTTNIYISSQILYDFLLPFAASAFNSFPFLLPFHFNSFSAASNSLKSIGGPLISSAVSGNA